MVIQVTLYILSVCPPQALALFQLAMISIWIAMIAVYQAGINSEVPWFLKHGCDEVYYPRNRGPCVQAKSLCGISVALVVVYAAVGVWSTVVAVRGARRRWRESGKEIELVGESEED